jgi:hypothetical protein
MHRALPGALAAGTLAALVAAAPASATTHQTWHLWSKQTSILAFDASGNPIDEATTAPTAGSIFTVGDVDYLGDHTKHGKQVVSTDHLDCTFTQVDLSAGVLAALCYGEFALPGGMVLFDHQTVDFGKTRTIYKITGGTGRYDGATGSLTADSYGGQTNDTDVVLRVTY